MPASDATSQHARPSEQGPGQGPKYCVNTEGTENDWSEPTITTEQIAELGGWDPAQGVVQINEDNTERTLEPGEVVELRPGRGFCRKIRWKRGFKRSDRLNEEIALLRAHHWGLEDVGPWVRIPSYPLPAGWSRPETDVAFEITDAVPAAPPYGFYVQHGLTYRGQTPNNYRDQVDRQLPFPGGWGVFSWSIQNAGDWHVTADIECGANLLKWVSSFARRFEEGI